METLGPLNLLGPSGPSSSQRPFGSLGSLGSDLPPLHEFLGSIECLGFFWSLASAGPLDFLGHFWVWQRVALGILGILTLKVYETHRTPGLLFHGNLCLLAPVLKSSTDCKAQGPRPLLASRTGTFVRATGLFSNSDAGCCLRFVRMF